MYHQFYIPFFSENQSEDKELWARYKEYRKKHPGPLTNKSFHFWKNNDFKDSDRFKQYWEKKFEKNIPKKIERQEQSGGPCTVTVSECQSKNFTFTLGK